MSHDNAFALYLLALFILACVALLFGGDALIRYLEKGDSHEDDK